MNIKEIKPINFLYFRTETKLTELENHFHVAVDLFKEAVRHDLRVTGPIHWHYFGFQGDPIKPFTLEISLPVADVLRSYDGPFHFKRTEPFKCVTATHEGAWHEMSKTYSEMMGYIMSHNLKPLSANREVYINADFNDPSANTTEIQIGVQ